MPEPRQAPRVGFPAGEALWRLLRLRGHEGGLQAFLDAHGPFSQADTMPGALEREGCPARLAQAEAADLPHLELPALLQDRDGSWLLLRERSGADIQVETPRGRFRQSLQELQRTGSGLVLERFPSLGEGSLWPRLRTLAGQHRTALLQVVLATLLLQALGLAGPLITGVILNRALPDGARSLLGLVAAGILLVALHQAWLGWFRGRVLLYLVNRMEAAAERGFLQHLLRLPFPVLQSKTVGELLQAFGGLSAARELLVEKTLGSVLDGAMAFVLLGAMAWTLPGPTLTVLAATLAIAAGTLAAGLWEARLQRLRVPVQGREQGYLSELLAGIGTLKAAGAEQPAHRRWCHYFRENLRLDLRQGRLRLWTEAAIGLLYQSLAVGLLVWGGREVLAETLSLGDLFAFLQLSSAFMGAVLGMVGPYLTLVILGPRLAPTQALFAEPTEPAPARGPAPSLAGAVRMEAVGFRYHPESPWVLSSFDLRVEPGGHHSLQSASGSGKTTILRLLSGLLAPEQGRIRIGGQEPRQARHALLYLPQFVQIMGGTVLENLRILSGGASLEALLRAARRSGLEELVATLPLGYQTPLPHGGRSLSGGQRQLIALTAALASDRPLLLLDEAMANLDLPRAAHLWKALREGPWTIIAAGHGPLGG